MKINTYMKANVLNRKEREQLISYLQSHPEITNFDLPTFRHILAYNFPMWRAEQLSHYEQEAYDNFCHYITNPEDFFVSAGSHPNGIYYDFKEMVETEDDMTYEEFLNNK